MFQLVEPKGHRLSEPDQDYYPAVGTDLRRACCSASLRVEMKERENESTGQLKTFQTFQMLAVYKQLKLQAGAVMAGMQTTTKTT